MGPIASLLKKEAKLVLRPVWFLREKYRYRNRVGWATVGWELDGCCERTKAAARIPFILPNDSRFPSELGRLIVTKACSALRGNFDIAGLGFINLGKRPAWNEDPLTGAEWSSWAPSRLGPVLCSGRGDLRLAWEFGRLQHLPTLAYASLITGEAKYAKACIDEALRFVQENPCGLGIHWICPMEAALRAISLSWATEALSGQLSVKELETVYQSLWQHGDFITNNLEFASPPGNHLITDLVGLLWLGTVYPEMKGARDWRSVARELLSSQLEVQIRSDGMDFESSSCYHAYVLELLLIACALHRISEGRAEERWEAIAAKMADCLSIIEAPNGCVPQFGDNDSSCVVAIAPRHRRDWRHLAAWTGGMVESGSLRLQENPIGALLDWRPAKRRASSSARRAGPVAAGAVGGYLIHKYDGLYVALNASEVGRLGRGGHGHNDKLSITVHKDADIVVDPGSFLYTRSREERDEMRRTSAHATLALERAEQNEIGPDEPFRLRERSNARVLEDSRSMGQTIWVAEHWGFKGLVHRRRVEIAGLRISIEDLLAGEFVPQVLRPGDRVTIVFPLGPGYAASVVGACAVRLEGTGPIVDVNATANCRLRPLVKPMMYSPGYGAVQVTQKLALEMEVTELPLKCRTTLSIHV